MVKRLVIPSDFLQKYQEVAEMLQVVISVSKIEVAD